MNLISKLTYEMQPLRLERLYPAELIRQVAADFLNGGLAAGFSLAVCVAPGAGGCTVRGDGALLRRALGNLVGNSIRHNPGGCAITLRVRRAGQGCVIAVEDSGGGLPQRVLGYLHKGGAGGAALGDGARPRGMGLLLVVQVLRAHGGAARFSNLPGGGCRATLYLPLQAQAGETPQAGGKPGTGEMPKMGRDGPAGPAGGG